MADKLITGNSWSSGDQVTSALLNQAINSATFGTGAVDSSTTQISSGAIIVKDAGITPAKLSAGGPTWTTAGALTVSGDTVVGDNATIGYTATEGLILTGQGSTNDVTIKNDADTAVISIPTGTTNARVTGNLFVGIDDTTPNGLIQVHGGGAGQAEGGEIRLRTAAGYDFTYNHYFIDAYQDDLRIGREGGADITLSSSGSVGIGTTIPGAKLDIVSTGSSRAIQADDSDTATTGYQQMMGLRHSGSDMLSITTGPWTTVAFPEGGAIFSTGGVSNVLVMDSSGNVGIGTLTPAELLHVKSSNSDTAETVAGFGNGDIDVGLQIKTNGNGGSSLDWGFNAVNSRNLVFDTNQTERMRIDSSGNVGIGITTPSTALQVVGGIRVGSDGNEDLILKRGTPAVTVGGSTAAGIITTTGTGGLSGHVGIEVPANDADDGFYIATDSDLDGTVDNLAVKIIANGNVGIGTASPGVRLDVESETLGLIAGDEVSYFRATGMTGNALNLDIKSIRRADGSDWSTTETRLQYEVDGDASKKMWISFYNENSVTADNIMRFGEGASTEWMRIDNGKVGIGTASPAEKLHVSGNIMLDNNTALLSKRVGGDTLNLIGINNTGQGSIEIGEASTVPDGMFIYTPTDAGQGVTFHNGTDPLMFIENDGNVGIGTTSPAESLDVVGAGRFSTGVTFGTDTDAANKLDDYEEGTWIPTISFGGASVGVGYDYQVGTYTKIGDLVTASCYLDLSAKGSSTGAAVLAGMPFASRNLAGNLAAATLRLSNISFSDVPMGYNSSSTFTITLQETTNAGTVTALTDANFSDISEIMMSISYRV